jgi:hypothetical protein
MASGRYFAVRGPETNYGDGATGDSWSKIRVTGMGDTVNRTPAVEEACDISVATYIVGGPYMVSGSIDALWRYTDITPLLVSLLGGDGSEFTDTPESYAFAIGDDQGGYATYYYGCGVTSMELTMNVREFVRCRFAWIGQKGVPSQSGATEAVTVTDNAAVFYNAAIEIDGSEVTAKAATLRIDRKFDTDYFYLGSPLLQGLYMNGQTELAGTLTLGAGQYAEIADVITYGTEDTNALTIGSLDLILSDKDGVLLNTISCGSCAFTESVRSVTSRNMWDKTINYRCVLPTNADFSIT